jgi:hypothetical protein
MFGYSNLNAQQVVQGLQGGLGQQGGQALQGLQGQRAQPNQPGAQGARRGASPTILNQQGDRPVVRGQQGSNQRRPLNNSERNPREFADAERERDRLELRRQGRDAEGRLLDPPREDGNDDTGFVGGGGISGGGYGGYTGIVREAGEYNYNTAAAEVLHETAREKAIMNNREIIENYFEVRQLNRQERIAERGRPVTQEDAIRYSQLGLPERLPLTALDRHTGVIHWPAALMRPEFDDHRARLEQIFEARSYSNSGMGSPSFVEIKQESERMLATLQQQVELMDPAVYVHARKFITGLGFEGRFLAGDENVLRS